MSEKQLGLWVKNTKALRQIFCSARLFYLEYKIVIREDVAQNITPCINTVFTGVIRMFSSNYDKKLPT